MISHILYFDTPSPDNVIAGLPDYPAIRELQQHKQWVAWKYEWREGSNKPTKPPVNPHTGYGASHSKPATWSTYEHALERAQRDKLAGVGFVVADDYLGFDFDNVRNPVTGRMRPWVRDILACKETYAEVSPSGKGIRLFAKGKIAEAIKYDPGKVEVYSKERYLTVTGQKVEGSVETINAAPKALAACEARAALHKETWAKLKKAGPNLTLEALKTPGLVAQNPDAPRGPLRELFRQRERSPYFKNVNQAAMESFSAWVPALFSNARPYHDGYRIASADLGRPLQEDISIVSQGIQDFGLRKGCTPIDLVIDHGGALDLSRPPLVAVPADGPGAEEPGVECQGK